MGLFGRLGTLIKSHLNSAIAKAEDPEKMLNQIMLDMRQQLVEAKKQVAVAIADEKRLAKELEAEHAQAREWERRAMAAVRAADDGLAREALRRKGEHDELAAQFQKQFDLQHESVEKLKDALRTLNNKIEEAKRKKNMLIARQKRAEAQRVIQATMQGINNNSAFDTFARLTERVDRIEAETEAQAALGNEMEGGDALTARFKQLEAQGNGVDDALAELKAKMGLQLSAEGAPAGLLEAQPEKAPARAGNAEVSSSVFVEEAVPLAGERK
jgi:phage shock protein A